MPWIGLDWIGLDVMWWVGLDDTKDLLKLKLEPINTRDPQVSNVIENILGLGIDIILDKIQ